MRVLAPVNIGNPFRAAARVGRTRWVRRGGDECMRLGGDECLRVGGASRSALPPENHL